MCKTSTLKTINIVGRDKKSLNKWRDFEFSWIKRHNTVNILSFPKLICALNTISTKKLDFLVEIDSNMNPP